MGLMLLLLCSTLYLQGDSAVVDKPADAMQLQGASAVLDEPADAVPLAPQLEAVPILNGSAVVDDPADAVPMDQQLKAFITAQVKAETEGLNERIQILMNEMTKHDQEYKKMSQALGKSQLHSTAAFHARISTPRVYEDGSTIIFDEVVTNFGNAYASFMGSFTCPVDGYYHFSCSLHSSRKRSSGRFMVDGEDVQRGPWTTHAGETLSGVSTQTVITYCRAFAMVYVQAYERNTAYKAADLIELDSTFSGFLLAEA